MTIREIINKGYDIDEEIIVHINNEYFNLNLNEEQSSIIEIIVDVGEEN